MDKKNEGFIATITGYQDKGYGVGRVELPNGEAAVIEVPLTMIGDTVKVGSVKKSRGGYFGHCNEIVEPSSLRITPRCVHFGSCGGCKWQHIPYDEQIRIKEQQVRDEFSRILTPSVDFKQMVFCHPHWRYRNKMEYSFSEDVKGQQYLGLVIDSSKGLVLNLNECHLVNSWQMEVLDEIRAWWRETNLSAYHHRSNEGILKTLVLRESFSSGDRMVILVVAGDYRQELDSGKLDRFVAAVRAKAEPADPQHHFSVVLQVHESDQDMPTNIYQKVLFGVDHLRECLQIQMDPEGGDHLFRFNISPMSFFQPNAFQAERLYSIILQMAQISDQSIVYDLFCGTGIIGICAAKKARRVVGIEVNKAAVLDGCANAELNSLNNIHLHTGIVRHLLPEMISKDDFVEPDIVIVDPPRRGLDLEVITALGKMGVKRIVYVSCNPIRQVEDVGELMKSGYKIEAIQPIDQFPHTPHMENIVTLIR